MAESVFEAVKGSVTVREAAQMYGIEVNRSGMACCPFHDDKNPSMKLNEESYLTVHLALENTSKGISPPSELNVIWFTEVTK